MAKTTEQFISESQSIHGNKYNYTRVIYTTVKLKVCIICPKHGEFFMRPGDHIHSKQGCRACSNDAKCNTTQMFIEKATIVHNGVYDYSLVKYENSKTPVDVICNSHGIFKQKPNDHINGTKCPQCASNAPHTKDMFLDKASNVHGNRYNYTLVKYRGASHKVEILCDRHGAFTQTPDAHINQAQGCPHCRVNNFSKEAILWLEYEAQSCGITIQHAENGGEYLIPNTPYKADGFCKETNTVYEFWGDFWHGNPEVYKSTSTNRVKQVTFGELYSITMKKKQDILQAGYNIVDIWENDWYNIIKENSNGKRQ
jgi:hypothetical protein